MASTEYHLVSIFTQSTYTFLWTCDSCPASGTGTEDECLAQTAEHLATVHPEPTPDPEPTPVPDPTPPDTPPVV